MPDKKISELDLATTPLGGGDFLAIVQGGVTKKTTYSALSDGQAVSKTSQGHVVNSTSDDVVLPFLENGENKYLVTSATSVRGFDLVESGNIWEGKSFFIVNMTGANLPLSHLTAGVTPLFFPSGSDMILPERGTAELNYVNRQMNYVGVEFSETGGETSLLHFSFNAGFNCPASLLWFGNNRETGSCMLINPVTNATYDPTLAQNIGEGRLVSHIIPYESRLKSVNFLQGTQATPMTLNIHNFTGGLTSSDNKTVASKIIPSGSGGVVYEYTGSEIDTSYVMPKNSKLTVLFFNNNIAQGLFRANLITIEIEKV